MAVDSETGAYLPFQLLMRRRRKHGIDEAMENYPVVINFFDVLYLDGAETTSMPLSERRALLGEDSLPAGMSKEKIHKAIQMEQEYPLYEEREERK